MITESITDDKKSFKTVLLLFLVDRYVEYVTYHRIDR
jgi:hypothetical protein